MPRKQLGMVDDALLARVDARAVELGQTRRVFTERALELALSDADAESQRLKSALRGSLPAVGPSPSSAPRPSGHPQRCPKCGGLHKGDCPNHPRSR